MKRTARMVLVLLPVFLLAGAATLAAQQYGVVYGGVVDEFGEPLPGTTLILSGPGAARTTVADLQGEFRFLNLDPGDYSLEARLEGFSTVEQESVLVAVNRSFRIDFVLTGAVEDQIVVTAMSPVVDERRPTRGTELVRDELDRIPTARDPWSVLNQAPGVLTTRVNVAGSESDLQQGFRGPGVRHQENDWMIDGVQIEDIYGPGATLWYFDFGQFEGIELSVGGPDVTKSSSGVGVNLVTRRGTNDFRGTARFISARDDGLGFLEQSASAFSCADLTPSQDCASFVPSKIEVVNEYGFEAGGPVSLDRVWLWGSHAVNDLSRQATGGDFEDTLLERTSVKLNAQLGSANSAVLSWNSGDKRVVGREAAPDRAPETTVDQRTPSTIWRFEDSHVFGANLFLTGAYQKVDSGAELRPQGWDSGLEVLWDADGIWKQNWWFSHWDQPQDAIVFDGSYFFGGGSLSHELKLGGRHRRGRGRLRLEAAGAKHLPHRQ